MKKSLRILVLISILVVSTFAASVKATVNDSNVVEGNSVSLTLEAIGNDAVFPDIEKVGPYYVESRSRMSSMGISNINGRSRMTKSSKLVLTFTPAKSMTIPSYSIRVDGQTLNTRPIEIKLVKSSAPTPGGSKKFSLDMVANKQKVYVGEPVMVSVFFNESREADLMKVEYQKPVAKDFFIKELGNEKTYQKGRYLVHELRYLLTPKYDGNFTVEPARARVAERGHRRDDFFGTFFDTPIWKRIVSNTLKIDVMPASENTDLVGDFVLSESIDATEVKANKPVNLTVRITGEGSLEDFEGPVYDIDGVTIYSDDPRIESHLSGSTLVSTFEKKYVFIADHNFTIPSRTFTEFDYKSGKIKTLKTKTYQIKVEGGSSVPAAIIHANKEQPAKLGGSVQPSQSSAATKSADLSTIAASVKPTMLILVFLAGVLLTILTMKVLPKFTWSRRINPMKESEALKILYPHINDDPDVEKMVRLLYAKRGGDKSVTIDKKELRGLVDRYREQ